VGNHEPTVAENAGYQRKIRPGNFRPPAPRPARGIRKRHGVGVHMDRVARCSARSTATQPLVVALRQEAIEKVRHSPTRVMRPYEERHVAPSGSRPAQQKEAGTEVDRQKYPNRSNARTRARGE
jgi:hypothetical protein